MKLIINNKKTGIIFLIVGFLLICCLYPQAKNILSADKYNYSIDAKNTSVNCEGIKCDIEYIYEIEGDTYSCKENNVLRIYDFRINKVLYNKNNPKECMNAYNIALMPYHYVLFVLGIIFIILGIVKLLISKTISKKITFMTTSKKDFQKLGNNPTEALNNLMEQNISQIDDPQTREIFEQMQEMMDGGLTTSKTVKTVKINLNNAPEEIKERLKNGEHIDIEELKQYGDVETKEYKE